MIEKIILDLLKGYTEAFYHKDFDNLVNYLYQEEIKNFRENLEWMAKAMKPFGETEGFMALFKGINTEEFTQLSDKEFIALFFGGIVQKLDHQKIIKIISSMRIEEIDHAEYIATVEYSFDNVFEEGGSRMASEASLIKSQGVWYILFRPGMEEAFDRYKLQISDFQAAKKRDNSDFAHTDDDDIETFGVYGFRTYADDIIIYPRFKAVQEFSEGLAAVKAFTKWGFINKKGNFVIQPSFTNVDGFSEGLAKVGMMTDNFINLYGFIDKKGTQVIDYQYHDTGYFSEGLAAVQLNDLWGYVNRKGKIIIDFIYAEAEAFENGEARVDHLGNLFFIDHDGKILRELDEDEASFDNDSFFDDEEEE